MTRRHAAEEHAIPYRTSVKSEQVADIRKGKRPVTIGGLHPGARIQIFPLLPPVAGVRVPRYRADRILEQGNDQPYLRRRLVAVAPRGRRNSEGVEGAATRWAHRMMSTERADPAV